MYSDHNWIVRGYDKPLAEKIRHELGVSPILARILAQRGINTNQAARRFLYPDLQDLSDPFELGGIRAAVDRIEKAAAAGERIVIYGDYDVDGVCSTVLLMEALFLLGVRPDYYVPDRFNEGYGLNSQAIEKLAAEKCQLLITVDCGITSLPEVNLANRLGMEVIITDHHTPLPELPAASAVINPRLDDHDKTRDLAGVGVAFKLAAALVRNRISPEQIYDWLDLVALATVADIVTLHGDNRIMVSKGLERLRLTKRPGLLALLRETGLKGKRISSWHLGFVLGPRLNSAGRMDHAGTSIDLLLDADPGKAADLARYLCRLNDERKSVEELIYQEALLQAESVNLEEEPVLALAGDNWHQGVIGIVASRLAGRFSCPVIMISWEGENGKGSARSIPGLNIYEALNECRIYLNQFGGHKMAAGLSIDKNNFGLFKKALIKIIQDRISEAPLSDSGSIIVDGEIEHEEINKAVLEELRLLEPFGEGNPCPCFVLRNVSLEQAALVGGKREHFKARIEPGSFKAIAFNQARFMESPIEYCNQDLLFEMEEEEFQGRKSISVKVKEMKACFRSDRQPATELRDIKWDAVLDRSLSELQRARPVLYVYPTYRSMKGHRQSLERYFRPQILRSLHGLLAYNDRIKQEQELRRGAAKIFLTTRAMLEYFLSNDNLPANLHYIVEPFSSEFPAGRQEYPGEYDVDRLRSRPRQAVWKQVKWEYNGSGRTMIYAHRSKTVQNWSRELPDVFIETGLSDSRARRILRRSFREARSGVLLTDFAGGEIREKGFADELLFADVPFSCDEAGSILELAGGAEEDQALVLFGAAELAFYKAYLQRCYPDLHRLRDGLQAFKKIRQNPLRSDLDGLVSCLRRVWDENINAEDLLPILHVWADLGLCQVRKKGSIIEIRFNSAGNNKLDVSGSPYYLEGLAARTAFARLEGELSKYLEW